MGLAFMLIAIIESTKIQGAPKQKTAIKI